MLVAQQVDVKHSICESLGNNRNIQQIPTAQVLRFLLLTSISFGLTGFVLASGIDRLDDIERYVRAIIYRLEHLAGGAERDRLRLREVVPLEQRYARLVDSLGAGQGTAALADVAWQLEELRVATFAQPLVRKSPGQKAVSAKRIASTLDGMLAG